MSLDVMKQALEVLESVVAAHGYNSGTPINAITALRAAIEQAHGDWDEVESLRESLREHMAEIQRLRDAIEQEPVAWMNPSWIDPDTRGWASDSFESIQIEGWIPLYTAPRQWKSLTQREIDELWDSHHDDYGNALSATGYERAIEAKLKEKNS